MSWASCLSASGGTAWAARALGSRGVGTQSSDVSKQGNDVRRRNRSMSHYSTGHSTRRYDVRSRRTAMDIPRRNFLLLVAGALFQADNRAQHDMLVRSVRPEDLEMPFAGFSDYITPIDHFFVRTHVTVPKVDLNEWR